MRSTVHILAALLLTAAPSLASTQGKPDSTQVTLRVRSTAPGHEVRFKGAFLIDDSTGIQLVSVATTPLEVVGHTLSAIGLFEKLGLGHRTG